MTAGASSVESPPWHHCNPDILIQFGLFLTGFLIGFFFLVPGKMGMFRRMTTRGSRAKCFSDETPKESERI
ncbi:MAG: hypothetical protein E4G97_06670 [Deltaproteobacteria bacterium]|nr:MAG: hypothetical protein E4G97_06670 [Deltaproteobacteria bacterium]